MTPLRPTLVVTAYNRPNSLRRLLRSLDRVRYEKCPRLVISIDYSGSNEALSVAEGHEWKGEKTIIQHPERLGLKKHIMTCGELAVEYGAVILLEDDLVAAPGLFEYATAACEFFGGTPAVAGISLHNYCYNESSTLPFYSLAPDNSNYFAQLPSSWGEMWTARQWQTFKDWLDARPDFDDARLPANVRDWPETSWKKEFLRYMIDTDGYFVYPGVSFTANCGEAGENVGLKSTKWVPKMISSPVSFEFQDFSESAYVYDSHLQLLPSLFRDMNERLSGYDFCVDLGGRKIRELHPDAMVLTTLPASPVLESWALELRPPELNVLLDIEGEGIHLCRNRDILSYQLPPSLYRYYYPVDEWNLPAIMPPLREQLVSRIGYYFRKLISGAGSDGK